MDEVFPRLHSASYHQCIGGTHHRCIAESYPDVIIIILFKRRICNDVENVTLMVKPVFIDKPGRNPLQLIGKTLCTGNLKTTL
ncbi:hypothetical protein J6B78_01105 [Methanocorpusculum sp.]|nr:hypothetical protein [Methanocorpusculum sp.]